MIVSTGMAAALLLRSLNQDKSLSALVQNLYNLELLTFEKFFDCLSAEDGQKETSLAESAYSLNQSRSKDKQKSTWFSQTNPISNWGSTSSRSRGSQQSQATMQGVVPTWPAPKQSDKDQFSKCFKQQMEICIDGQTNMIQEDTYDNKDKV